MKLRTKKKSKNKTQIVTVVMYCRNIGKNGILKAKSLVTNEERVKKISKLYEASSKETKKLIGEILAGDIRVERTRRKDR